MTKDTGAEVSRVKAEVARIEADRAKLPKGERQFLEAGDDPLLRIQLLHMLERALKAEATIARVQVVVDAAQGCRWLGMGWGPELLAALNAADGEPVQFAHVGGNAEDCPACEGSNPPYPFICPGPSNKEA